MQNKMIDYQLTINWPDFIKNYWQKRPLLIKQGFVNFIDPISADDLAGLAMEDEVDSRLVSFQDGSWNVTHGPFDNYQQLGEAGWSLLVQAVNHWHYPSTALLAPFRVLSDWRIDDLMVSYSVPSGGVGPHIDQYDVFIIQGLGRRHWRVGEKMTLKQHCPHPGLLQVEPFAAIIDEQLEPGDILYIPPGFPHEGYSIETSLNYSVGFRSPTSRELFSSFADYLIANDLGSYHYSDPNIAIRDNPAMILPTELTEIQHIMQQLLAQPQIFTHWFGSFISQSRHELDIAPPDPSYTVEQVIQLLRQGNTLYKLNGLRTLCVADQYFVNGEQLESPESNITAINILFEKSEIQANMLGNALNNHYFMQLVTKLINDGYWYFND